MFEKVEWPVEPEIIYDLESEWKAVIVNGKKMFGITNEFFLSSSSYIDRSDYFARFIEEYVSAHANYFLQNLRVERHIDKVAEALHITMGSSQDLVLYSTYAKLSEQRKEELRVLARASFIASLEFEG